jgi:2-oxoglutarate dehydrogenase E1 component
VHLIINNQIGFTPSDPRDMRSSTFCTDIVKMVESPVLHVNGDDPEAVVLATQLALEFRMEFRKDVVVDIVCFRKLGHNEQDTPALTQPLMYKKIAQHPGTRKLYADKLAAQGLGETLGDEMAKAYRAAMDAGKHTVDPVLTNFKSKYAVDWSPFLGKKWTDAGDTAIPLTEWKRLAEKITTIPETVTPHQLVKKVYDDRAAMGRGEVNVDWGMGETMAFASLVASGYPVRLSGEDSGRGTFTHRHAVIHDQRYRNERPDQDLWRGARPGRPQCQHTARRGLWRAGAERRGQVDPVPYPAGPDPAHGGRGAGHGPAHRRSCPSPCPCRWR